jgi:replication-associated recombination protein RarA
VIAHWSEDPFARRTTLHGLPSDEVRSALHKHVRQGRLEQAIRAALELARTDPEHEHMMWLRLRVIAAEDVGLGEPVAPAVVAALHQAAELHPEGAYERLEMAAQAAGYLATAVKDPMPSEVLQVAMADDAPPEVPDEAVDVHTRRGQELGRTVLDWWRTGSEVVPEVPGRDRTWRDRVTEVHERSATDGA